MYFDIREIKLNGADAGLLDSLVACWRGSVEATHMFLTPGDVDRVAGYVPDAMRSVEHLAAVFGSDGEVLGFAGVDGAMVEMLFVDSAFRGQGLGTCLLDYAVQAYGAVTVDVNEQNDQAVGFYLHYGFEIIGRSPVDSAGDPYPILHMRLANHVN